MPFREFLVKYRANPLTFEKVMPRQSFPLGDRKSDQTSRFSWNVENSENLQGWSRDRKNIIPDAHDRAYVEFGLTLGSDIEIVIFLQFRDFLGDSDSKIRYLQDFQNFRKYPRLTEGLPREHPRWPITNLGRVWWAEVDVVVVFESRYFLGDSACFGSPLLLLLFSSPRGNQVDGSPRVTTFRDM